MAKIHSYGSARTAPMELIPTAATGLTVGDLATITAGKVVAAGSNAPTYLVLGERIKQADGTYVIPVCAILDDMILYSSASITGYTEVGANLYRK